MSNYDVAIIGGGAAGLSAALVLPAPGRTVLVVDAGAPRNAPAAHMHGYLSRDGIPPAELLAAGRDEVSGLRRPDRPTAPSPSCCRTAHGFWVLLADGRRIAARRLLVTTGLRDELPDIPGLRERWARDVLHCPYCHGHEVRDRRLGVIGGTRRRPVRPDRPPVDRRRRLLHPARHPHRRRADRAGRPRHRRRRRRRSTRLVVDDDRLRGVQMDDGCVVPRDALFVPPRFVPNNGLLVGLGCDVDDDGWVVADTTGRTSVPGVWAAGNVVDPRAQVITAAGAGSAAAIALNADLVEDDVRVALG